MEKTGVRRWLCLLQPEGVRPIVNDGNGNQRLYGQGTRPFGLARLDRTRTSFRDICIPRNRKERDAESFPGSVYRVTEWGYEAPYSGTFKSRVNAAVVKNKGYERLEKARTRAV